MATHTREIVVAGGGVSGLTTAIVLAERGHRVEIRTRERRGNASVIAAAVWEPYKTAASERSVRWARRSYQAFDALAREESEASGVRMVPLFERTAPPFEEPWWREVVRGYRGAGESFFAEVPIIETPRYLPYLEARFSKAGGRVVDGAIDELAKAASKDGIVINCTGLGARTLASDRALIPVRGQVVRVENPGVERCSIDDSVGPGAMTYVIPRSDGCVIGGTYEEGEDRELVDPQVIEAMLERARALEPALKNARVLNTAVGVRPYRAEPRIEREELGGGVVAIHNYGHGGAGFTLSWGCAEEAADLVER
jgi:D-amino-acid oxidase